MGRGRQSFDDGEHRDVRGLVNGIAERAGRYRREGQGFYSMIAGDADALMIATGERFGLVLSASSIHWAHGVNYILGGQSSAGGDDSFASGERADFRNDALALLEDRGTASV